jgi:hypothetical protein
MVGHVVLLDAPKTFGVGRSAPTARVPPGFIVKTARKPIFTRRS